MKTLTSLALKFKDNKLWVLNQQNLPQNEDWIDCESPNKMCHIIHNLQVRGAPLIGIAAAMALAHHAEKGADLKALQFAASELKACRPTAVNLSYCIDQQLEALKKTQDPKSIVAIAEYLFEEDARLCEQMAAHGAPLIQSGDNILTHCNTGGLVTTGMGTALGVIIQAHRDGKKVHVYVDETRPLLQGGRLTAWELERAGVPYTLCCDSMAATLMRDGDIQAIFLGADRIAANGDFANKIGTYSLAALAQIHQVPFYTVAPYTTIDPHCPTGSDIPIEERTPDEVRGAKGHFGQVIWSPPSSPVYNPAFDVTPAHWVTGYVLNTGVKTADALLL